MPLLVIRLEMAENNGMGAEQRTQPLGCFCYFYNKKLSQRHFVEIVFK